MGGERFFKRVVANSIIAVVVLGVFSLAFAPRAIEAATRANSGAVSRGNPSGSGVAIMFNVYDGGEYVTVALDILSKRGHKATFFVGGAWTEKNESIIARIFEDGHGIGNHGYFGRDLRRLTAKQVREELLAASNLIERITGEAPGLFAPPLGGFNRDVVNTAANIGMTTILRTRDTGDTRLRAGDFILMRPTAAAVAALDGILDRIEARGLTAVTVTELI